MIHVAVYVTKTSGAVRYGDYLDSAADQWKNWLWAVWLAACAGLTSRLFLRELEAFRHPGPAFLPAFIALASGLTLGGFLYARLRPKLARWELPVLVSLPAAAALLYDARATVVIGALLVAAYVAGDGLLKRCGLTALSSVEDLAISTGLGFGAMMYALFWLGLAGLYWWWVFGLMIALPPALHPSGLRALRRSFAETQREWTASAGERSAWGSLGVVFGLAFLACGTALALAPSLAFDVLKQHLPAAMYYGWAHRLTPLPLDSYSYFPQGVETMMAMSFALGGQTAAQLLPVLFFAMAMALGFALARRLGLTPPAALMAAVCAASMPFLHWTGSVAKNDLAMTFFELASLYALLRWQETTEARWLVLSALFLSLACNVKYAVIYGAAPLALLLTWCWWRDGRRWRVLAAFAAIAVFVALLWPARAWVLTGRPLYPESLSRAGELQIAQPARPWTAKAVVFLITPWTAHFGPRTRFSSPLEAPMGIFLPLFAPAWVLARTRLNQTGRWCLFFSVLYLVYWAAVWPVLRFGAAGILVIAILTAVKLRSCYDNAARWTRAAIRLALAYSLLFALAGVMIMGLNAPQLRLFAKRLDRVGYLRETLISYPSLEFLKTQATADDRVLAVDNCSIAYAPAPWNYQCLGISSQVAQVISALRERGARFLIVSNHWTGVAELPGLEPFIYRDGFFTVYRVSPGVWR